MISLNKEAFPIIKEQDVIFFRNRLKEMANRMGMSLVNQTKLITAASELVRNMLKYANGGRAIVEIVSLSNKTGMKITFEDKGPGIADIKQAMQDGYSSSRSLGMGLPGA